MMIKKIQNTLLIFSSIIVSIIIAELSLNYIDRPSNVKSGWKKWHALESNELGFRGREIKYEKSDYVILLLGDSQVEAEACSYYWLPETRLEFYLNQDSTKIKNFKVFSIGTGGYGQDQQYLMLEKYYKIYRADLILLWQTPGNDVWNNIFPTHWPTNGWPKPTYWLKNGELLGPSEQFGQELESSKIKVLSILNKVFQLNDRDGKWEQKLPQPYEPLKDYNGPICTDWQNRWDENIGSMKNENLTNEKSHLSIHLAPISQRMKYGLDLTKLLLHQIENLANRNKSEFIIFNTDVHAMTASKFETEEQDYCSSQEVVHILNDNYYKTSNTQYLKNLEYLNNDFSSYTVPVTEIKWKVGPTNSHLNEHANDQVMRDLAEILISKY